MSDYFYSLGCLAFRGMTEVKKYPYEWEFRMLRLLADEENQ